MADNRPLNIIQSTLTSDENGRVSFEFPTEFYKTVAFTLETTQQGYAGVQAKGTYEQRAYSSSRGAYIAIDRRTHSRLRPGDLFRADIHLQPLSIRNTYYLVVARGKILAIGKVPETFLIVQRIFFPITPDMVPSFRLVVFAHHGRDLIADSLRVDVEKICSPNAEITVDDRFNIKEPGMAGKIIIRGAKDTAVGLLAVDEAVYNFSKGDLLTKDKMFEQLGSHDLGCGPGGGFNTNSVLGNAGVMLVTKNFRSSHTDSCVEFMKKKRSLIQDTGLGGSFDVLTFLDSDIEDEFERQTTVRRDFRETWMNLDFLIGSEMKKELEISLPHSITTWVIQAVSLSPTEGMCVTKPKKLVSFKKIFLHINLPYSIKQYEQVEVKATVFNYDDKDRTVYVYRRVSEGICSGGEPGMRIEKQRLVIKRRSAETATFSLTPLKVDDLRIVFHTATVDGRDTAEKKLHIVPQGMRVEENAVIRLDPTNRQKRFTTVIDEKLYSDSIDPTQNLQVTTLKLFLPEGAIPGTAKCSIKVTGDIVGLSVETSLENPDGLIQMPSGSGEQNMIRLAPTIYALKYLKSVDKLTAAREDKGYEFIRAGYDNELKYKKEDGSYSAWSHAPTSTWLTAFVLKVFCQGADFIPIDGSVISSGIDWIIRNQQDDGSYIEENRVYHKEMMGGGDGTVSMTAFALITIEECKNNDLDLSLTKQRAMSFLESHRDTVQAPLPAAILAYALALTNSTEKHAANEKLLGMAEYDQDSNYMYWTTKYSAQDIETAGYTLLTQLLLNDMNRSIPIVNWLNTKQLQSGQFKSTQDTVIALQALSEYAIKAPVNALNLVSNVTSSRDEEFHRVFTFNTDNALEVQELEIEEPDGMLLVKTAGTGMGTISMRLQYNVLEPENELCKFDIKTDVKELQNDENVVRAMNSTADLKNKEDLSLNITICMRYLGDEETEMSIADVGIFSGFKPVDEDLEKIERDPKHFIQKYENLNTGVVFYLEKVPIEQDYCFAFRVYREYIVGKTQPSMMKVYDYNNPDATCTKFYGPTEDSVLRSTICGDDVCECDRGDCPPESPFADLMKVMDVVTRRAKMNDIFCDDFDYVWKGKAKGRAEKLGQFLSISFEILEVIKAGVERKEDLENKVRVLRARDHCKKAYLYPGVTYLVMGKDPPPGAEGGVKHYEYLLDNSSIIYPWEATDEVGSRNLQTDLSNVTDKVKTEGCLYNV